MRDSPGGTIQFGSPYLIQIWPFGESLAHVSSDLRFMALMTSNPPVASPWTNLPGGYNTMRIGGLLGREPCSVTEKIEYLLEP